MIIKWKISRYRKDMRSGVLNPIKPSEYYKYLSEGVGYVHKEKSNADHQVLPHKHAEPERDSGRKDAERRSGAIRGRIRYAERK